MINPVTLVMYNLGLIKQLSRREVLERYKGFVLVIF